MGHLSVHEHVWPEGHVIRVVHGQVFFGGVGQRHVGGRDAVVEEKGIVAVGCKVGEDVLDFVVDAETINELGRPTVFDEILSGVAVVDSGVEGVVEAHDFGGGVNVPFADQGCVVACVFELLGDSRVW